MTAKSKAAACKIDVFEDVFVNYEGLIFRGWRIYRESFVRDYDAKQYRRVGLFSRFLLKNYWLRRGAVRIPAGIWVTDNFSPASYYHWMVECLPRILRVESCVPGQHVLLLPSYYARDEFLTFTLGVFPQVTAIGWIGPRTKVRVAKLFYVPRQPAPIVQLGGSFLKEQISEISRRVATVAGEPGHDRRIYFSRPETARRRLVNEHEVVRLLRRFGFEIVRINPARPAEQIRAARGAKTMVAAHGAELTNLMFMPAGGSVLEFHREPQDDLFFDCYRALADASDLKYVAQTCKVAQPASGYEINQADLIVNVESLRESLERVLRD